MSTANKQERFREDINGLRAWAVALVVLFHFGVPVFPGGFVGVDVFFVISGFLMTGLIIRGLESPKGLSIVSFYLARIRRIVPALFVLCAVLIAMGWFLLPAPHYKQLALHAASALGFVSNFTFMTEAGYFEADAHYKWLLHTWSLSVEWQFYLVLPVVVAILWRISPGRKAMLGWFIAGFLISLMLSVVFTPLHGKVSFYMLPTRAWEMLAGGIVFLLPRSSASEKSNVWPGILGLLLVIGSAALFDSATIWPGWLATLPVLGTALVLVNNAKGNYLVNNAPAQWLGRISYSVYLWHWPLIVLLKTYDLTSPLAVGAALLITLALGHLSWLWIENPARHILPTGTTWRQFLLRIASPAILLVASCVAIVLGSGIPGRVDPRLEDIFVTAQHISPRQYECQADPPRKVKECTHGGPTIGAIAIGDSHVGTLMAALENAMGDKSKHVLDWSYSGCPTIRHAKLHGLTACAEFVDYAMEKQANLPPVPVLIASRLSKVILGPNEAGKEDHFNTPDIYFGAHPETAPNAKYLADIEQNFGEAVCAFSQHHPTFLMKPVPEMAQDVPRTMAARLISGNKDPVAISIATYETRNKIALDILGRVAKRCGATLLDPLPYLCNSTSCLGERDGLPIYADDNHLNLRGTELLQPLLATMFK